jgi:hypothetical protein
MIPMFRVLDRGYSRMTSPFWPPPFGTSFAVFAISIFLAGVANSGHHR